MTTSIAQSIRAALKTAGFNSRQISVKNDSYSMGSTVHVTIKSAEIAKDKIEEICKGFEKVDRCRETGEILSGGNSFVDVEYAHGILSSYAAVINLQVAQGVRNFGTIALVELPHEHKTMQMWDDRTDKPSYKVDSDAPGHLVARVLAARGELKVLKSCPVAVVSNVETANDIAPTADLSVTDPNFFLC